MLLFLLACAPGEARISVAAPTAGWERLAVEVLAPIPQAEVVLGDRPGRGLQVRLVQDERCAECYRVEGEGSAWVVTAGGDLGMQYGLVELLERAGARFYHPHRAWLPERWEVDPTGGWVGVDFAPEQVRRGLHLHTLHPIEGLFDVWEPGEAQLERAKKIVDWVVRSRGNHLQWVALEDPLENPELAAEDWGTHTAQIVEYAHDRGLTVGLGVQLFGSGNLQLAFDLIDDVGTPEEVEAELRRRLLVPQTQQDFDLINLSFGEFFAEDPETFLEYVNLAHDVVRELNPNTAMSTVIHVGGDLTVEYQGEEVLYYHLAAYADPEIVPWVHTVMYYNLFDDAGGAYEHEDFAEHRALLLDRLSAGEPVGYFPESAYWVAFDNSIPTWLPLYHWSRWRDLDQIAALAGRGALQEHVLFSSGWEWGYWQADYTTLRNGYQLERWERSLEAMYAPFGAEGAALSQLVIDTVELQRQALMDQRLAAYFASYDNIMELGYQLDIVSQPRRVLPEELAALDAAGLEQFTAAVLGPLEDLATASEALAAQAAALPTDERWFAEVVDGAQVNALRARYITAIYGAMVAHLQGQDPAALLAQADAALASARGVVARRHADLHDPEPARLIEDTSNPTLYQYGYLHRAHTLCFWERERLLAEELITGQAQDVPGCGL